MEIITISEAKKRNLRFYFTGKPCVRGHISHRYVDARKCAKCAVEDSKAAQQKNPEITKRFYEKNKQRILDKKREYKAKWYEKNKDRLLPKIIAYSKEWRSKNPEKHAAREASRRAVKLKATPRWLNDEHQKAMLLEYELAKWCSNVIGVQYDVDHIVPLKGKLVCGLHVPWNLQVILASDNRAKGNKHVRI